ncbi:hypothetical protein LguiA_002914 [Lonicera macranthoides]
MFFIFLYGTSKEISDLEGELSSIRNLLSTQATLIHGPAEGVHIDSLPTTVPDGSAGNDLSNDDDREPSDLEKWLIEFPDLLDVLLAERRVDEALASLDEGGRVASEAKDKKTLTPNVLMSLETAIAEHRQKLADQLAEAAGQPSTHGGELRAAISALKRLGDGPFAHTLSQLVFSAIAEAAGDSWAIFGEERAYSSELVMWATKQTEVFALLVKRHVLASSAAGGGLRAAAECVQIALGHCSLLEARALALCPVLLKLFRPSVEQALDANIKPSGASLGTLTAHHHKLSSSALRLNITVQDFFEDVGPLLGMQLGGKTLEEAQLIALLANASFLADDLLPRAAMKLAPFSQANYKDDPCRRPADRQNRHSERREWKKRLVGSVDSHLSAEMYLNIDGNADEIEWLPSPIFQEVYAKLNRMATIAADMFIGRERFATLLLMRLTETVFLWLSEDQTFWDDIEEGPMPLGPLGFQQFYLDMKFVIYFASQGCYLSQNLHRVVNEIISKVMAAFDATGMDPYRLK